MSKRRFFFPLHFKLIFVFTLFSILPLSIVLLFVINRLPSNFEKIAEMRINNSLSGIANHYEITTESLYKFLNNVSRDELINLELLKVVELQELSQRTLIDRVIELRNASNLNVLEVGDAQGIMLADGSDMTRFNIRKSSIKSIRDALSGKIVTSIENNQGIDEEHISLIITLPVVYGDNVIGTVRGGYYIDTNFIKNLSQLSNSLVLFFRGNKLLVPPLSPESLRERGHHFSGDMTSSGIKIGSSTKSRLRTINLKINELLENIIIGKEFKKEIKFANLISELKKNKLFKTHFLNSMYMFGSVPIRDVQSKEILGLFVVGVDLSRFFSVYLSLGKILFYLSGICIISSIILGIIFARKMTRPIHFLVRGTKEFASGNLSTQINVKSNDELGLLVDSFNYMGKELKENQEKLVRTERIAAWRDIAQKLAHEIKNPLTPIQISVQNLQKCFKSNRETFEEIFDDSANIILSEIEKLRKLANEFSRFAKLPSPTRKYENIIHVLQNAITLYQTEFNNVKILADIELGFPELKIDAESINIVFSNLIKNAIDAMPEGGTLTITAKKDLDNVSFIFTDTGKGIKKENLEKIFTPYFTTKDRGSGLGLPIVQKIIEDHGGKISVESEEGKSTTLTVILPMDTEKSKP